MTISVEQAALNLGVTLGLSAVIGFERQWRNRFAGLRTNMLVVLGAASLPRAHADGNLNVYFAIGAVGAERT